MQYRQLGPIKKPLSVIGFGGGAISGEGKGYGFGDISEKASIDLLVEAKNGGINVFDTAPIYGFGLSEQRIGKAFRKCRDEVFIISKAGITWDINKRVDRDNDPKTTLKMLDQSLRDLQTDYIDLYMMHWPDERVDIRKSIEVLAHAQEQGKIAHIGLCNTTEQDLVRSREIVSIDALQGPLNLYNRATAESLFELFTPEEMGYMGYGTFDKGILTKRVDRKRTFDPFDARSKAIWWKKYNKEEKFQVMDEISKWIEPKPFDLVSLAIGASLKYPHVSMALCGARTIKQLHSTIEALSNLPSDADIKEAIEICDRVLGL